MEEKAIIQNELIQISESIIPKLYWSELAELSELYLKFANRIDREKEVRE